MCVRCAVTYGSGSGTGTPGTRVGFSHCSMGSLSHSEVPGSQVAPREHDKTYVAEGWTRCVRDSSTFPPIFPFVILAVNNTWTIYQDTAVSLDSHKHPPRYIILKACSC